MTDRTFRCRSCGHERLADTPIGPLPTVCATCDPEAAERRRVNRARANAANARRAGEVTALRARVAELEERLEVALDAEQHDREFNEAADWRRHRLGEPGRDAVGRAVRALAHAKGRAATRAALLDVCAACRAWARLIAITGEHDTDLATPEPVREAA